MLPRPISAVMEYLPNDDPTRLPSTRMGRLPGPPGLATRTPLHAGHRVGGVGSDGDAVLTLPHVAQMSSITPSSMAAPRGGCQPDPRTASATFSWPRRGGEPRRPVRGGARGPPPRPGAFPSTSTGRDRFRPA